MNEYFRKSDSQNAAIQRLLERQGYYDGSIDGVMGPQSRRAIRNYQTDRGMTSDGIITAGLLRLLGL
jgi:peptidoglycan hydrolase-like protein with peptidoglycan-binding domain